MNQFSSINHNIISNINRLKKEWRVTREIWKDAKSMEYEKKFLVPIVIKQKGISSDLETLERISSKLRSLGVDV